MKLKKRVKVRNNKGSTVIHHYIKKAQSFVLILYVYLFWLHYHFNISFLHNNNVCL